jgi:hypothetical protein
LNQKLLSRDHLGLSNQPAFCQYNRGFSYCESEVAGETASLLMCDSLPVNKQEVRLQPQFFDAGNFGRELPEGKHSWNVWKLGFAHCRFML